MNVSASPWSENSAGMILLHTVSFALFFVGLGAILCGLLWVTGRADLRVRSHRNIQTVESGYRGLSELPFRLQR